MTTAYPYPRFPDYRPLSDSDRNIMADLAHEGEVYCPGCEEWIEDSPEARDGHEIEICETHWPARRLDGTIYCHVCGEEAE